MYKLNTIFMLPMRSREDESMIGAFKAVYNKLEGLGHKPKLHILDNECSKCIQNFLEKKGTARHMVAPHNHRVNAAEPAVKTAKYHLIAALATLDDDCPIQLWSKMIKQQRRLTKLRGENSIGIAHRWSHWDQEGWSSSTQTTATPSPPTATSASS